MPAKKQETWTCGYCDRTEGIMKDLSGRFVIHVCSKFNDWLHAGRRVKPGGIGVGFKDGDIEFSIFPKIE
jgi:hypothetical protein